VKIGVVQVGEDIWQFQCNDPDHPRFTAVNVSRQEAAKLLAGHFQTEHVAWMYARPYVGEEH
jgi:hypothetical protein